MIFKVLGRAPFVFDSLTKAGFDTVSESILTKVADVKSSPLNVVTLVRHDRCKPVACGIPAPKSCTTSVGSFPD